MTCSTVMHVSESLCPDFVINICDVEWTYLDLLSHPIYHPFEGNQRFAAWMHFSGDALGVHYQTQIIRFRQQPQEFLKMSKVQ